jgi:hypothetical protein
VAFAVGLQWGIIGVAALFAVSRTIAMVVFTWLTCRTIAMPVREFVRSTGWVAALSLPMGVAVYLARVALVAAGVPAAARLAVLVLLGAGVYGGLLVWRAPELLSEVRGLFRRNNYAS